MATLVALLGLVLLAMHEAGKPKTWERLGFGNATVEETPVAESPDNPELPEQDQNQLPDQDPIRMFWQECFADLNPDEQRLLLNRLLAPWKPGGAGQDVTELVNRIQQLFQLQKNRTPERFSRIQQIEIARTLEALAPDAETPDSETTEVLKQILATLDELAYRNIKDRTTLGRVVEKPAWYRSWDRLIQNSEPSSKTEVSFLQLTAQPGAWRGKPVSVSGQARALERVRAANPHHGIEFYHVLWVKPRDSNQTPWCIYARELPDGFPRTDDGMIKLDEPITATGIFFKLRSYVATNEKIESCPLILADTIQWKPAVAIAVAKPWRPANWLLTVFFIGMPLVACWLAVLVWRSTTNRGFAHGKNRQQEILHSLDSLADNPEIKSDRERIRELNETGLGDD